MLRAKLKNANLSRASLIGVVLRNADLSGVDLKNADLFGADLFAAENYDNNSLRFATLCHTRMPDGAIDYSGCRPEERKTLGGDASTSSNSEQTALSCQAEAATTKVCNFFVFYDKSGPPVPVNLKPQERRAVSLGARGKAFYCVCINPEKNYAPSQLKDCDQNWANGCAARPLLPGYNE
jgi:hypothetical protein